MLYALYRRYVRHRPTTEAINGLLRIGLAGILAVGVWAMSGLAFGLGPVALVDFYRESAGVYPVTSANAFNVWGIGGFWLSDSSGGGLVDIVTSPSVIGIIAFLTTTAYVISRCHRAIEGGAHEALTLTIASATVALVSYVVLTRMHERYMFVALMMFAPLAFVRPLRVAYAALSGLFVLNLWFVYAAINSEWTRKGYPAEDFLWNPPFTWIFGPVLENDTPQKKLWSLAVTLIAGVVVWRGMRWAELATPPATPELLQDEPLTHGTSGW